MYLPSKMKKLGTTNVFKLDIPLTTEKAVRIPQYPIPKKQRDLLNDWVKEMLGNKIIRPTAGVLTILLAS